MGPPTGDFGNYLAAAALWREGAELARLYDYRWFTDQAARLGLGDRLVGFAVLTPPSALLAVPLLPLGVAGAGRAWLLAQVALALSTALLAARAARLPAWAGLLAWAPLWPALRGHLEQGQGHLVAAALVALGLCAWQRGRDPLAGAALGLAVGLKVFAWPLLPLAAATRRPRLVAAAGLVLLAGALGSVALLGLDLHRAWLAEVAPATASGMYVDPWHPGHQSLAALARRLWLPHPALGDPALATGHARLAFALPAALALLLPLQAAAAGAAWPRLPPDARARLLAAATLAALVAAPNVSRYGLVLLLPPVLLAAAETRRAGRGALALALALLAALPAWAPTPATWPDLPALGVPRAWALLALWLLLLPWRPWPAPRVLASAAAAGLALLAGLRAAPPPDPGLDGATPLDHPAMPLVAADLLRAPDGDLYFSGLSADRGGLPGRGWLGFALDPDEGLPRRVEGVDGAHVFSPRWTGEAITWAHGPDGAAPPAPVACGGGELLELRVDGQQDIAWRGPDGRVRRLTTHPAHDAAPACDEERGRVWFLSDRGVGLRALRLWWLPLPG